MPERMKEDVFWRIIAASRDDAKRAKGDDDFAEVHMDALKATLLKLKPEEIIAFDAIFTQASRRAYRWDLWAAAYWLGGGCSDDGFMDFRACLVSLGKDWYDRVLANPDALAD